ncbi:PIG-L deacetylase family protein [Deinococcus sp. Marseille-Q6407]|uniref:PIG-L deacetylase family protein n=1 Tax=Deinococcus sp. Marseille-Q6407 TaxID=2969223 RepID=UPI0021C02D08|nr:PIG-L deacetylase family protein [Deinococcus sp. Marseille-Q6407]
MRRLPEWKARTRRVRQALGRFWGWVRQHAVTLALVAALALAAYINLPDLADAGGEAAAQVAALPETSVPRRGERLLVLSPHPDDETLCCGGYIQRARAQGAEVYLAWVTAGDGFVIDAALTQRRLFPGRTGMRRLAARRQQEARDAAAALGVPAGHLTFLGYPDDGLTAMNSLNYTLPYTSPHTGASAVYLGGVQTPGAPFTGQALEADLNQLLDRVRPTRVLVAAPQDHHGDHHTLGFVAMRLLAQRGQEDRLTYWLVHGGVEWPLPKGEYPELPLRPAPLGRHLPWQRLDLTPEEQQHKREAIRAYRTQTAVLNRFMEAFDRRNELFSPRPLPGPVPQPVPTVTSEPAQP